MMDNVIHTEQDDFLLPIYYGFDYDTIIDLNYKFEKPTRDRLAIATRLCEPHGRDLQYVISPVIWLKYITKLDLDKKKRSMGKIAKRQ